MAVAQVSALERFPLQTTADGGTDVNRPLIDSLKACQTEAFDHQFGSPGSHRQRTSNDSLIKRAFCPRQACKMLF